jgi:hypothetical protein
MFFRFCEIANFTEVIILTLFAVISFIFDGVSTADIALVVVEDVLFGIGVFRMFCFDLRFEGDGKGSEQISLSRMSDEVGLTIC